MTLTDVTDDVCSNREENNFWSLRLPILIFPQQKLRGRHNTFIKVLGFDWNTW